MRSEILPETTSKFLAKFTRDDLPKGSFLGGGTAIALWLGHRQSQDLDWFSPSKFDEAMWQERWETEWEFTLVARDWQTLIGKVEGVKLALYLYKYPLIEQSVSYQNIEIARLKDLAAMKIDAVLSRGTKRDFIDLYFMSQQFSPDQLLAYYDQKYGGLNEKELMIRKALVYFSDADEDEMPKMLVPVKWKDVKAYFIKTFI